MTGSLRARAPYLALALSTIALGLSVHWRGAAFGAAMRDMLGDTIWAAMVAWLVAAVAPGAAPRIRAGAALAVCYAVELSQLYHTPALDALRSTVAGHLVLGSGFDPRDLAAYAVGVLAARAIEHAVVRPRRVAAEARKPAAS